MNRQRPRNRRPSFALLSAVAMIALVAVALVGVGHVTRLHADRTRRVAGEAQVRQLLLAGTEWATAALNAGDPPDDRVHALPPTLAADGSLRVRFDAPDDAIRRVVVTVTLGPRSAAQVLTFSRTEDARWQLKQVRRLAHRTASRPSLAAPRRESNGD